MPINFVERSCGNGEVIIYVIGDEDAKWSGNIDATKDGWWIELLSAYTCVHLKVCISMWSPVRNH